MNISLLPQVFKGTTGSTTGEPGLVPKALPGDVGKVLNSGGAWVAAGAGSAAWGSVTGTLSAQSDLSAALATKVATTRTVNGHALSSNVTVTATDVGLGSASNTSDATKNSATATLTNKTLTAPVITSPTGLVKADVGLGSVTNDAQLKAADLDTDVSLSANSDTKIASQKAIKAYVDAHVGAGGSGINNKVTVTQASHGFTAETVVYYSGSAWVKCKADDLSTATAVGVIESVTTDTFQLVLSGQIALSGKTVNTDYFLSDGTAGAITAIEPTTVTSFLVPILRTSTTIAGFVDIGQPLSLSQIPASAITLDTDGTLAANSDVSIASQKAVKTYADTKQAALSTVGQSEAEAGTATTGRIWTAQRVKQAIVALGTGGGTSLTVDSSTVSSPNLLSSGGDISWVTGGSDVAGLVNSIGALVFPANSGIVTLIDMPVTSAASAGVEESIAIDIDGTSFIKAYSESDGAGGLQNKRVEILGVPLSYVLSVYASGTVYSLTGSSALAHFGTGDPTLVLDKAGTWLLIGRGNLKYNGATFAANQTATLKLRRTNNTAADVPNSTSTTALRIVTTITDSAGEMSLPYAVYTTANTNDSLSLFGVLSATPSAGSVDVTEASILAIRLP